jgi:hypothetical protein
VSDFETPQGIAVSGQYLRLISHDAFSHGALNKSAALVYWCLVPKPLSPMQLVARSGRSRATVYRALHRMSGIVDSRTGEMLPLVEKKNGLWSALPGVDLDRIALILGTAGRGRRKRAQYERERAQYRRRRNERSLRHQVSRRGKPHQATLPPVKICCYFDDFDTKQTGATSFNPSEVVG